MLIMMAFLLSAAGSANQLAYACGGDQVRELRIGAGGAAETWRWTASDATDLPADYREQLLAHIDECKPVDDGRAILVTASTGGAVLIDRATGRVTFRARVPTVVRAAPVAHGPSPGSSWTAATGCDGS